MKKVIDVCMATGTVLIWLALTTSAARGGTWMPLFDGHTLNGWTTQNGKPVRAKAWRAENGILHLDRSAGRGGNILTDSEFGNFEMVFEWKNSPKGNSGIKYRVKSFDGRVLGCEYQMIDDASFPKMKPKHATASLYDVYDANPSKYLKPVGQFNHGRIVVCGNRIQHWLNGQMVMCAIVGSCEWQQRIAESKFSDVEGFGENRYGKIMLTDHNDEIWFRNIFIRHLSSPTRYTKRVRQFGRFGRRPFYRKVRCR